MYAEAEGTRCVRGGNWWEEVGRERDKRGSRLGFIDQDIGRIDNQLKYREDSGEKALH